MSGWDASMPTREPERHRSGGGPRHAPGGPPDVFEPAYGPFDPDYGQQPDAEQPYGREPRPDYGREDVAPRHRAENGGYDGDASGPGGNGRHGRPAGGREDWPGQEHPRGDYGQRDGLEDRARPGYPSRDPAGGGTADPDYAARMDPALQDFFAPQPSRSDVAPPARQPGRLSGAQPDPRPGPYPGRQSGPLPGLQRGRQSGAQPSLPPGRQSGPMPGLPPGRQSGAMPGLPPGRQSGAMPGLPPGRQSGSQPRLQPGPDWNGQPARPTRPNRPPLRQPGQPGQPPQPPQPAHGSRPPWAVEQEAQPGRWDEAAPRPGSRAARRQDRRPPRRGLAIAAVAVAVVVVLGIVVAAFTLFNKSAPPAASTPPRTTPSAGKPAASASARPSQPAGYALSAPATAGGYQKLTAAPTAVSNVATATAQAVREQAVNAGGKVTGQVTGYYQLSSGQVMSFAGYEGTFDPAKVLAAGNLNGLGSGWQTYPAGSHGGDLSCAPSAGTPGGTVCVWVTGTTLGVTEFFGSAGVPEVVTNQAKAAQDTVNVRADVEAAKS